MTLNRRELLHKSAIRRDSGYVCRSNHFGYGLELKPPPFWRDIAALVTRKDQK
jgi:hypothetical protein